MVEDMVSRASRLEGYIPEPYRQEEVLAATKMLAEPFILREVVAATGLPTPICHQILSRLVKKGIFTRFKIKVGYTQVTGGRWGKLKFRPGGAQRRVYAYRRTAPAE